MNYRELSDRKLEADQQAIPRHTNWASTIGNPCTRRLVLDRLFWEEIPPFPLDAIRRMRAGSATERNLLQHLQNDDYGLGLSITRQQERALVQPNIHGRIEGFIGERGRPPHEMELFEIKCLAPSNVDKINAPEDFGKFAYYAGYPGQAMVYMLAKGVDHLRWFVCPRGDHLAFKDFIQEFSQTEAGLLRAKAELIEDCVNKSEIPDAAWNWDICRWCHWEDRCWAGSQAAAGDIEQIDDPEIEAMLDRREELKPLVDEYEEIEKKRKDRFRNVSHAICGSWEITAKPYTVLRGLPAKELPSEYTRESEETRMTIRKRKVAPCPTTQ